MGLFLKGHSGARRVVTIVMKIWSCGLFSFYKTFMMVLSTSSCTEKTNNKNKGPRTTPNIPINIISNFLEDTCDDGYMASRTYLGTAGKDSSYDDK